MKVYNSHEHIQNLVKKQEPILRYQPGEDFAQWQQRAKAKLEELLGLPLEKCPEDGFQILEETSLEGYVRKDFEFQSEPGYFVRGSLLVPDGTKHPIPGVICIQGHSTGMHISLGIPKFEGDADTIAGGRDFAVRAVKEGFCAVTLEQRYMGTAGQNEQGHPACITANEGMAALLLGRTAIGERVWDVQRLIDVIQNHFQEYIDGEQILCMGNSGGGTATFYAACIEERIALAVPSCSVCTYEDSIMAMYHCPCNFIPGIRKYFDMGDLGALIAPHRLVVVCGTEDPIFPLHGTEVSFEQIFSIYQYLGKEKLCRLVKGEGGHQFYPDEAWPVIKALL